MGDIKDFLESIIPPDVDKDEFIEVATRLAFFDSIHDFWPERKTNAQSPGDDEDETIDISEDRLRTVHTKLGDVIAAYTQQPGKQIDEILSETTGGSVTSVNDIENRVIKFLSANYSPFNGQHVKITFTEILTSWKFEGNWDAYSERVQTLPDNIDIVGDGRSVKSLTDSERGIIAFFILAYMNPTIQPGSEGSNVNLTFDMAPRDIGKLFLRLSQVYNAIFPQNIADSATTSFSALQGRNQFFKADGTMGDDQVTGSPLEVKSNLFSFETYKLEFVDKNFGPKNKFGFSIVVSDKNTNTQVASIDFMPRTGEQGPPVNYLMDILASGKIEGVKPRVGTAVKLPQNIYNEFLLFDLKRMGDHEQMRVDNVYGVTGDRLAYVYRRLLRKPGIYHSHVGFRVFRSLGNVLDVKENVLRNERFKCVEIIEKLKFILQYQSQYDDVNSELSRMKEHVRNGAEKGTVLMDTIDVTTADFLSQHTEISSTFATYFVRLRMQDIYNHIETLQQKLEQTNPADLQIYYDTLTKSPLSDFVVGDDNKVYTPDGINITDSRIIIESALNSIEELRNMNIAFDTNGNREPYYVELFDTARYRLKKGVKCDIFNFSSGPYLHNETGMQVALARLLVARRARRIDAIAKAINDNLVIYLHARDLAKEAFFSQTLLNSIEEATDVSNGLTLGQIVGVEDINPGDKNIITAIRNLTSSPLTGGVGWQSSEQRQKQLKEKKREEADERMRRSRERKISKIREIPPILQYRDIHDIFVEICLDSEETDSVDELESKWTLGINDIRAQSEDEYGRPFEESDATDIITFFLSFRSGVGSVPIFTLKEGTDTVYGNLSRKINGTVAIVNYIGGAMLTAQVPENVILNTLRKFASIFKQAPNAFEAYGNDGTEYQWSGVSTQLQEYVIEETGYKMGGGDLGGRRPLYANVRIPSSSTLQHKGLRKRTRTRRATRVR